MAYWMLLLLVFVGFDVFGSKNNLKIIRFFISNYNIMEKQQNPKTDSSTLCKYFGNEFIKCLKEKQLISSQRIYYLNMLLGCGNSQKK
jgi:hypothetical protein